MNSLDHLNDLVISTESYGSNNFTFEDETPVTEIDYTDEDGVSIDDFVGEEADGIEPADDQEIADDNAIAEAYAADMLCLQAIMSLDADILQDKQLIQMYETLSTNGMGALEVATFDGNGVLTELLATQGVDMPALESLPMFAGPNCPYASIAMEAIATGVIAAGAVLAASLSTLYRMVHSLTSYKSRLEKYDTIIRRKTQGRDARTATLLRNVYSPADLIKMTQTVQAYMSDVVRAGNSLSSLSEEVLDSLITRGEELKNAVTSQITKEKAKQVPWEDAKKVLDATKINIISLDNSKALMSLIKKVSKSGDEDAAMAKRFVSVALRVVRIIRILANKQMSFLYRRVGRTSAALFNRGFDNRPSQIENESFDMLFEGLIEGYVASYEADGQYNRYIPGKPLKEFKASKFGSFKAGVGKTWNSGKLGKAKVIGTATAAAAGVGGAAYGGKKLLDMRKARKEAEAEAAEAAANEALYASQEVAGFGTATKKVLRAGKNMFTEAGRAANKKSANVLHRGDYGKAAATIGGAGAVVGGAAYGGKKILDARRARREAEAAEAAENAANESLYF